MLIAAFFCVGVFASKSKKLQLAALAVAVCLAVVPVRPDLLVRVLPFSWVVFYSNFFPFAAALVIPSIVHCGKSRSQAIRLRVLGGVLLCVTLLPYRYFLLPPATSNRQTRIDANGICRQTSADTCGAATVVTLLRLHGVEATEDEVARYALTRRDVGTGILGEYRALKILTQSSGKPLRVCLKKKSVDELAASGRCAIITAGLHKGQSLDTEASKNLVRLYHWTPGAMHNVVFMGADKENPALVRIGEPDFGVERWSLTELRILYQGFALWLEEPLD